MAQPRNVQISVTDNIAIITVDLTKDFGKSGTGKSNIVASSGGWQKVADIGGKEFDMNLLIVKK